MSSFNAKLGKREDEDEFLGPYGRTFVEPCFSRYIQFLNNTNQDSTQGRLQEENQFDYIFIEKIENNSSQR